MSIVDELVDANEAGELLGVTATYIRKLARADVIERGPGGKFRLADLVRRYVVSLKTTDRQRLADEARLRTLKIEAAEMRNKGIRARMFAGVADQVNTLLAELFAELGGVPQRCTRDVELRREMRKGLNDARNTFAAKLDAEVQRLRIEIARDGAA